MENQNETNQALSKSYSEVIKDAVKYVELFIDSNKPVLLIVRNSFNRFNSFPRAYYYTLDSKGQLFETVGYVRTNVSYHNITIKPVRMSVFLSRSLVHIFEATENRGIGEFINYVRKNGNEKSKR